MIHRIVLYLYQDMNATILFLTSNTITSRLVKWATGGPVSHVAIGGFMLENVPLCLHADIGGVRFVPRDVLLGQCELLGEYGVLPDDVSSHIPGLIKDLGSPYDFTGLLGFGWYEIGRWLKLRWNNPWRNPHAFICTELVLGMSDDVPEWKKLDPATTSPTDLLRICQTSPSFWPIR
jgi:hypothetical protein